jgi:hypothetical protein
MFMLCKYNYIFLKLYYKTGSAPYVMFDTFEVLITNMLAVEYRHYCII